jgi:hypothetical protein
VYIVSGKAVPEPIVPDRISADEDVTLSCPNAEFVGLEAFATTIEAVVPVPLGRIKGDVAPSVVLVWKATRLA